MGVERHLTEPRMTNDLTAILNDWPHEPGKISARLLEGPDGMELIQVRIDLGILQMHADGRPDGQRPNGFESLLDYFEDRASVAQDNQDLLEHGQDLNDSGLLPPPGDARNDLFDQRESKPRKGSRRDPEIDDDGSPPDRSPTRPDGSDQEERPFTLTAEECAQIRDEAAQYVQRCIACMAVDEYSRALRDAARNLRAISLCAMLARDDADRQALEPYRGQLLVLKTKALAAMAMGAEETNAAIYVIDEGLESLRRWFTDRGAPKAFDDSAEVEALREMRAALAPVKPAVSQRAELQRRLQEAIAAENYELAAILRDELRQLKD